MGQHFLTAAEKHCLDALTGRLIPSDEYGPGAPEAGVTTFIDRQLAGFFGRGDRWYMQAPFRDGIPGQGYQSEHAPAQLYRRALASLDAFCRATFGGRLYAELETEAQDELLRQMEAGDLSLEGVSAETFFGLLWENTIEGFFCDPLYGGNRDMVGWKLVGFPGARYDYRDVLDHNGAPVRLEPVGLMGGPQWRVD
ncbi:hypothetical protein AUP43_05765 [Oceanibaculum pacificum]|uniref:Gluconate 2-dehydrogenase n=1 Tax=Oceanibaculum pacificum TaxID=580166 RepID=A0A154WEN7_9PROT|nr:hypothetical protein AUP43_05765 [Oceanibaculum pacificum]